MAIKLTIGMAVYDDFDGFWFSVQALRLYHDLSQVELIVVDNHPGTPDSRAVATKCAALASSGVNLRYIAMPHPVGTSAPRERVFHEAAGEAVLVIDSHVLVAPGAIGRLIAWYDAHPDSRDLLSGPMLFDDLHGFHTHFDDRWRGEMWGTWGNAWRAGDDGENLAAIDDGERLQFISLAMKPAPISADTLRRAALPALPHAGHQRALVELGLVPLGACDDDEFEIPAQGLGLFSCRRSAWPGFNPHFRQFGGEEMYLHEKFRARGAKCLCLGFLKWAHRFDRPGGVQFPLSLYGKVRNYVLGHLELGRSLNAVHDHFVRNGKLTQAQWDYLIADPIAHENPPSAPRAASIDLDARLAEIERGNGPFASHVARIRDLAQGADGVVEITRYPETSVAIAAARPARWQQFVFGNAAAADVYRALPAVAPIRQTFLPQFGEFAIDECDLLVYVTPHAHRTLAADLARFAPQVRRAIVLHDTQRNGHVLDGGGQGYVHQLREFITAHPEWFVASHVATHSGLTLIGRQEQDRPEQPIVLWPPGFGPGTEMKAMLAAIGINPSPSCDCNSKALQMDMWGVAGCKDKRETIIGWIREGKQRWKWSEAIDQVAAADGAASSEKPRGMLPIIWSALTSGLAFRLNPLDPVASLVDEAIRRAELKQAAPVNEQAA